MNSTAEWSDVQNYLLGSVMLLGKVAESCSADILIAVDVIEKSLRQGHKILLCGNGGSAADCQHIAAELVVSMKNKDRKALAAIALTTDGSVLTASSNDYGFDGVFERQVEALGMAGDVLWVISTSGKSKNVLLAVRTARSKRIKTIGLTKQGSDLVGLVDVAIALPSNDTQLLQEAFLSIEHYICLTLERRLFGQ